jgi:predicted DNA-binding transcriptional regulator AlpA
MDTPAKLISAKQVMAFFGNKTKMTLHRWLKDEAMGFPQPVCTINRIRFWDEAEVIAFQARMMAEGEKTGLPENFKNKAALQSSGAVA